jgi:hypothetical protein
LREDVGPFLVQQTCYLSPRLGGVVSSLRLFPTQDFSANSAIAHRHRHIVNRGICRQRKHVDGLNRFFEWVFKFLLDVYARQKAADLHLHIRVLEWAETFCLATLVENLERALGFIRLCRRGCART